MKLQLFIQLFAPSPLARLKHMENANLIYNIHSVSSYVGFDSRFPVQELIMKSDATRKSFNLQEEMRVKKKNNNKLVGLRDCLFPRECTPTPPPPLHNR